MDESTIVRQFLRLMESRDLAGAEALLAPEFVMVFPGAVMMHRLEELVAWSQSRYTKVVKSFDRIDVGDGYVFVSGMLSGEWRDGTGFAGIRYIDRFEVEGGLIRRQEVWNDMAESLRRND